MAWNRECLCKSTPSLSIYVANLTGILTFLVLPHLHDLVYISGAIGCCGMTMTMAFVSDMLSLLTAHICLCYLLLLVVFRQQLHAASSLWKLFQGEYLSSFMLPFMT